MRVAALFVQTNGCYFGLDDVDPWDIHRDARTYAGPFPVVAHPPCDRWCQMAPVNQARYGHKVGDDGGCFASALASVRRWGGVLEHPALSLAWPAHCLPRPVYGGWTRTFCGGWVCHVDQRNYGHRATKGTWLYAVLDDPPSLKWEEGEPPEAWISTDRPRADLAAMGIAQLSKAEAKATPHAFRDVLLGIARAAAVVFALVATPTFAQDVFVPQGLKSSAEFLSRPAKTPPRIRIIRIPYRVWRSDELKPCKYEAKR